LSRKSSQIKQLL